MLLIGCSSQAPVNSLDSNVESRQDLEVKSTPSPTETFLYDNQISPESHLCQETFEAREMREPYQRYEGDEPRYTLSEDELLTYLEMMGIKSICLPTQFGAPFINVDWGADDLPATGRMVSIGFEELYGGGGWSHGYLVFATYDFSVGSEYEVFASPEDFDYIQSESIQYLINADGVKGFLRFHPGIPMGMQSIMKTYIFPFEDFYVAAVINLGAYDPTEVDSILLEMEAGSYPDLMNENVALMDFLVSSIRFR